MAAKSKVRRDERRLDVARRPSRRRRRWRRPTAESPESPFSIANPPIAAAVLGSGSSAGAAAAAVDKSIDGAVVAAG